MLARLMQEQFDKLFRAVKIAATAARVQAGRVTSCSGTGRQPYQPAFVFQAQTELSSP